MRQGELFALRWEDVSEDAITVIRSLGRVTSGPIFLEPKTTNSRRRIVIDPETAVVLKAHRKRQLEERLRAGPQWEENGLVFPSRVGKRLQRYVAIKVMDSAARKAGVPRIRFHDLRHTHATLRQGVNPKVVAERLGHSDVAITLRAYSHALPDTEAEAAKAIGKALKGAR